MILEILFFYAFFRLTICAAPSGPWDQFNYAPDSRTVRPVSVHSSNGSVQDGSSLIESNGKAKLSGRGSWIALDFGKEARNPTLNIVNIICLSL